MCSHANTLDPERMCPVTGGLEQPDPPSSPHGTELKPTVPRGQPMSHCFPYQTMARERDTQPGNLEGWATCFQFLYVRFPTSYWPSKPRVEKNHSESSHSWVLWPLPLHLSAEHHELGQQLLLGPLLGDGFLPPAELSWAVVSQGPRLPISPHCFMFSQKQSCR